MNKIVKFLDHNEKHLITQTETLINWFSKDGWVCGDPLGISFTFEDGTEIYLSVEEMKRMCVGDLRFSRDTMFNKCYV